MVDTVRQPLAPGAAIAWGRTRAWLLAAALVVPLVGCNFEGKRLNGQGVHLFQQGNLDASQVAFQQALQHDPQNSNIYYNLGRVHQQRGKQLQSQADLQKAESYFHLALDQDDNNRDCYRALAVLLLEQDRAEQAFTLLEGWAMRSPKSAEPRIELARLYEEFNELEPAKEKLMEALKLEPNHPRALAALGNIHERQGDYAQALADYKRSLYYDQQQPEVASRVAALQLSMPRLSQAVSAQPPLTPTMGRTLTTRNRY